MCIVLSMSSLSISNWRACHSSTMNYNLLVLYLQPTSPGYSGLEAYHSALLSSLQRSSRSSSSLQCQFCGKAFPARRALDAHMLSALGMDELKKPCPVCHKQFTRKDNMISHFARTHPEEYGMQKLNDSDPRLQILSVASLAKDHTTVTTID